MHHLGNTLEEVLNTSAEAMSLHLYGLKEDGLELPALSNPAEVKMPEDASPGSFVTLIDALTEPIHFEIDKINLVFTSRSVRSLSLNMSLLHQLTSFMI
ncbi:hypothetical protein CULT_2260002 [[Clostridium] ultunense Esp]|nr:hypothetical protein CULT_2260002 [[Clostridium] ultunense Esp]